MILRIFILYIILQLLITIECNRDNDNHIDLRIISIDNNDSNNILDIRGYGFGYDESLINVKVGNKSCNNAEICSKVCQSCEVDHCSSDSVCIVTKEREAHCFMPCSGPNDESCPCDMFCDSVKVHSFSTDKSSLLNLCTPHKLSSDDICKDYNSDKIRCNPDKEAYPDSLTTTNSYTTKLGVNNNSTLFSTMLSSSLGNCDTNADCYDGDICTIDTCENGKCLQEYIKDDDNNNNINNCQNYTIENKKRRDVFYSYLTYHNDDDIDDHFSNFMTSHGTLSPTSNVDDYPIDKIELSFSFMYFGTVVNSLAINPNGVLMLPPIYECRNVINSVSSAECIVYATDTNTIGIFGTDWDPSHSSKSNIYYYNQHKGDNSNLYGNDQTAFHVLFSKVTRFQANKSEPISYASFAASIYTDGSIRLNYIEKEMELIDLDVFGLWGSRASQYHSNLRYHEEKIPSTLVKNGSNIYYCNIEWMACIEDVCVAPGKFVNVKWKSNSCLALSSSLTYSCEYGDGLASTSPLFSEADKDIIYCPVPTLNVKDGTIVSLTIKISSSSSSASEIVSDPTMIRSVTLAGNELTQSRMTIRYSSSSSNCGCSSHYSNLKCDAANVCGGFDDIYDCFGTPFGSAYFDSCHKCSGGLSGIIPMKCFDGKNNLKMWFSEIISFTMLLCFFSFLVASFYVIFARMSNARQNLVRDSIRLASREPRRGLSQHELECIGDTTYSEDIFNSHQVDADTNMDTCTECSICLTKFKNTDIVRLLPAPCKHVFHISCIDEWFKLSTSCPLCKRNIRNMLQGGDGFEEERTQETSSRIRLSRQQAAIQILFNRLNNQTHVNRGLIELRRALGRGSNSNSNSNNNNRPDIDFVQIPQNDEV